MKYRLNLMVSLCLTVVAETDEEAYAQAAEVARPIREGIRLTPEQGFPPEIDPILHVDDTDLRAPAYIGMVIEDSGADV